MKCEVCGKTAKYYRKIDQTPRPLCKKHYDAVGGSNQRNKKMIQRHYFEIETATTVKELKDYCRKHGLKNWSRLHKKNLERFVKKHKEYGYATNGKQEFIHENDLVKTLKGINNEEIKKDIWIDFKKDNKKYDLLIPSYGMTWRLFDFPYADKNKHRRIHTQKSTIIGFIKKGSNKKIPFKFR